jgi:hypothetical protein
LALVTWKTRIFDVLKVKLIRVIQDLLTKERDGEQSHSATVAGVILSFGSHFFTLFVILSASQRTHNHNNVELTYFKQIKTVQLGMIKPNKALEIYLQELEPQYIKHLSDYYARESSAYISENGVSMYMKKAEQRLDEEEVRAKKYMDTASLERIRTATDTVLVDRHKAALYAECETMMRNNKYEGSLSCPYPLT